MGGNGGGNKSAVSSYSGAGIVLAAALTFHGVLGSTVEGSFALLFDSAEILGTDGLLCGSLL